MTYEEYNKIVFNNSLDDEIRKKALQELIKYGCLNSLFGHVKRPTMDRWVRNYSLLALVKFAGLSSLSRNIAITLQNDEISLRTDLNTKKLREEASRFLFVIVVTTTRLTKTRKLALMGLIAGGHWQYCDELLNDESIDDWIRLKIKKAKKRKKK